MLENLEKLDYEVGVKGSISGALPRIKRLREIADKLEINIWKLKQLYNCLKLTSLVLYSSHIISSI